MEKIIEKIEQYDKIILHRHVRPDEDAYGSQLGLKEILTTNYPEKTILAAGEHDLTLDYLGHPDVVTDADFEGALVIATDTANTERIDDQRYQTSDFIIKIDHHPNEDPYGDLRWVNTEASSCSEMIYTFFEEGQKTKGWTLSDEGAKYLFAGIVGDTGRFQYPSATARTFQVGSELVKYNFNRTAIFDGMYKMSKGLLQLQGYLFQNFKMDHNGAAYIKFPKDVLQQYGVTVSETSALVPTLGNLENIAAWVMFVEEDDQIRVRLRSKGLIINTIAKKYRGGGHPVAAGATIYDWTESVDVIEDLQQLCAQQ